MMDNLAIGEVSRQAKNSPIANGIGDGGGSPWAMPRPSPNRQKRFRKLYIGPWLARLGKKQIEAANELGVTPQYLSELVSGAKKNPEHGLLFDLSQWLGISMNDLYRAPPPRSVVEAVDKGMTGSEMAALGNLLEKVKKAQK